MVYLKKTNIKTIAIKKQGMYEKKIINQEKILIFIIKKILYLNKKTINEENIKSGSTNLRTIKKKKKT